jgi:hypothetical protein
MFKQLLILALCLFCRMTCHRCCREVGHQPGCLEAGLTETPGGEQDARVHDLDLDLGLSWLPSPDPWLVTGFAEALPDLQLPELNDLLTPMGVPPVDAVMARMDNRPAESDRDYNSNPERDYQRKGPQTPQEICQEVFLNDDGLVREWDNHHPERRGVVGPNTPVRPGRPEEELKDMWVTAHKLAKALVDHVTREGLSEPGKAITRVGFNKVVKEQRVANKDIGMRWPMVAEQPMVAGGSQGVCQECRGRCQKLHGAQGQIRSCVSDPSSPDTESDRDDRSEESESEGGQGIYRPVVSPVSSVEANDGHKTSDRRMSVSNSQKFWSHGQNKRKRGDHGEVARVAMIRPQQYHNGRTVTVRNCARLAAVNVVRPNNVSAALGAPAVNAVRPNNVSAALGAPVAPAGPAGNMEIPNNRPAAHAARVVPVMPASNVEIVRVEGMNPARANGVHLVPQQNLYALFQAPIIMARSILSRITMRDGSIIEECQNDQFLMARTVATQTLESRAAGVEIEEVQMAEVMGGNEAIVVDDSDTESEGTPVRDERE